MSAGFAEARADSLPFEVKSRHALMFRLLEAAVTAPNVGLNESRVGMPAGLPSLVQHLPGGAIQVSVYSGLLGRSTMGPGTPETIDRFALSQNVNQKFREFAGDLLTGRTKILEMGPRAGGDPTAVGSRHRHLPRGGVTTQYDPDEEEATRFLSGYAKTYTGDQDRRRRTLKRKEPEIQDQEEERVRQHTGISCQVAHGMSPHRMWTEWVDTRAW